jgi:uncharacterized Zn finger protein (UPF0148 family)
MTAEIIELGAIMQCSECGNAKFYIVDEGDIVCPDCSTMANNIRAVIDDDIEIDFGDDLGSTDPTG